jgi:hypothetical protein
MNAQMIAKAWMDDEYRAALTAQGFDVPLRPSDLFDDQLNIVAEDGDNHPPPPQTCC